MCVCVPIPKTQNPIPKPSSFHSKEMKYNQTFDQYYNEKKKLGQQTKKANKINKN
jgi:hypothetical protein